MYRRKHDHKMKLLGFICLFILATSLKSFSQVDIVFNAPPKQRVVTFKQFIDGSFSNPATTFKIIDSATKLASQRGDRELEWYADFFRVLYSSYKIDSRQQMEAALLEKQDHFSNASFREVAGAYYFYLGRFYFDGREFEKAFHYFVIAHNIFEPLGYKNLLLGSMFASDLFGFYYQFQDYPAALDFLKIALSCEISNREKLFFLNNIGVTYLKMNDYANASQTFSSLLREASTTKDTVYIGIASGNYGNVLRLQGKYAEALPYLYRDVELNRIVVHDNSAISCLYIASCLLHLDSLQKASGYIDMALQLGPDWTWSSFRPNYYETKALLYKKTKNFYSASLYQDSLQALTDSLKKIYSVRVALTNKIKFNEEKTRAGQQQATMEANNLKLTRNFIITFLLLVFAAILFFIYKRRNRERLRFEQKQRDADEMLRSSQSKLEHYIHTIREKNNVIEAIEIQLAKHSNGNGNGHEGSAHQKDIKQIVLLTEDDWKEFKQMFSEVYPKFFEQLHIDYPGLSQGEVRLLALCKLQLSSREMTNMLGISIESLRKSRYRLRKKYPQLAFDEDFKEAI